MFDRVVVISLPNRQARLRAFYDGLPRDWPFPRPIPSPGIRGDRCRPADWWRGTPAAWGCYRAHHQAIEAAISEGFRSLLILEDDATFVPGFAALVQVVLADIPADAGMVYLGGQHLGEPHDVGRLEVVGCLNTNRAHAYGLVGDGMARVYEWLHPGDHWHGIYHADHHYGRLHETGSLPCYAARRWLVGQRAGWSDCDGEEHGERFWRDYRNGGE